MKKLICLSFLFVSTFSFADTCKTATQVEGDWYYAQDDLVISAKRVEVNGALTDDLNVKFCKGKEYKLDGSCVLVVPERTYVCDSQLFAPAEVFNFGRKEGLMVKNGMLNRFNGSMSQVWGKILK